MNNTMRLGIALGGAAVVIAGGSAFTAANTVPNTMAGYGTGTVTGVSPDSVAHTLNAAGDTILKTTLVFGEAQPETLVIKAYFDADQANAKTCTTADELTYDCTWGNGTTTGYTTATAEDFRVVATMTGVNP